MTCTGGSFGFSSQEFCSEEARGPHPSGKNIPEDPAGGLLCMKTSEFEKTSSSIELTRELEGEQDLDFGKEVVQVKIDSFWVVKEEV